MARCLIALAVLCAMCAAQTTVTAPVSRELFTRRLVAAAIERTNIAPGDLVTWDLGGTCLI